ncbi:MAG TPA: N-acetyl-gamma-glutamyl-phosphate reductase [Fimbriimonadaceae bacterium]|nr:N-acetyl-gamma-glutamyl-phosphate reductase [Fimbriimonadaceae bacterium]
MAAKTRVAVVGASGYAGAEVVRLLASHPSAEVVCVTSSRTPGRRLQEACPWLNTDLVLEPFDCAIDCEVFFLCQEAGFAGEMAPILSSRAKVIDHSADFRLMDSDVYERIYKQPWRGGAVHPRAPYGLPELVDRKAIAAATVVAVPGCYPTAALLGLMPLIRADLVSGTPVIDGKSGVSGAGRSKTDTDYTFSELDGSLKPYAAVGHRHTPEIEDMIGRRVRFTPHLLPIARGMEITSYVPVDNVNSREQLHQLFVAAYKDEPFVHVQTQPPATKQVLGSNSCVISVDYDERTQMAVVMSVIDNLGKGAAGQGIQNLNIMLGLPETTGLPVHGVWP